MAAVTPDVIADILNSSGAGNERGKVTDLVTTLQRHPAARRLLRKENVQVKSGAKCTWNLLTAVSDNARHTGMYAVDNLNAVDGLSTGEVPWRLTRLGWTADVNEFAMNMNDRDKILDLQDVRKQQALLEGATLLEATIWGGPTGSTDYTTPYGLTGYWFAYNATTGLTGGNHTNFSGGPGGVDCGTYPQWKHGAGQYTNITADDFLDLLRDQVYYTGFEAPLEDLPVTEYGTRNDSRGLYTTWDNLKAAMKMAEGRNDNLGWEFAGKTPTFERRPFEAVPWLQENRATSDPVIGIDWSVMKAMILKGRGPQWGPVIKAPHQDTAVQQHMHMTWNIVTEDRKRHFAIAKAAFESS